MLMCWAGGQGQWEQWWEGAEALGLEDPLEICSAASGSSAKHFSGHPALGAHWGCASKVSLGWTVCAVGGKELLSSVGVPGCID